MFIDKVRIHTKAGDGGAGCCSFRREKFVPKGGPDGGDGGRGGDIILKADENVDTLSALYHDPLIEARKGGNGSGAKKHGRSAASVIVKVPVGTLVFPAPAPHLPGEHSDDALPRPRLSSKGKEPLFDLSEPGQEAVLCCGGAGGKGNVHFKSSRNRVPMQFTKGDPGEDGWFLLELRTMADAGLVGYPNAGKSTLLTGISAAHPKTAPYPFTTLHPMIGVVELPEYERMTVADIPGLIEGAHRNVGLGHEFLRHIVRCKVLVFVLDAAGSEGRDPVEDLRHLRKELDLYDAAMSRRPWIIAANKTDLEGSGGNIERLAREFSKITMVPISAGRRENLDDLVREIAKILKQASVPEGEALE